MQQQYGSSRRRRLWRFAGAEFDEASWALRVKGEVVALEGKPLEVLHELLLRAGEVVTKDELLDSVWPRVSVSEGSLPTAISKIRKAVGHRQSGVIDTVPRIGYRLACPVEVESIDSVIPARFGFVEGDIAPGRAQWRLERPLGDSGAMDVWLARHVKTGEQRVFKFADTPDRLRSLKREAALSRLLFAGLGKAAPMPALLEWNFESSPYFLEYAHGGCDLIAWGEYAEGGLAAIPLERRLSIAALICRAVADVHGMGVLHKDLKPANILIEDGELHPIVRLVDFGSGRLLDDTLLDNFRITNPGSLDVDLGMDDLRSGTLAYRAPELVGDAVPTVKSDIYALGLTFYQLVVGDFSKTLAPGWEDRIADPLLREDIRLSSAGDPAQRLASAGELAERIERLPERRAEAARQAEQAAYIDEQKRREERRATRRPWVRAAAASLVLGLVATSSLAAYSWVQRNRALSAQAQAQTAYSFIAEDVLASPDPRQSSADETVIEAIMRASRAIDERFADSPGIAARLHLAVARAFYQRSHIDTARAAFIRADALFTEAGEAESDDAVLGRLNWIHMEAASGQAGRLEEAGRLLEAERQRLGPRIQRGEVGFTFALSEGNHAYYGSDLALAETAFRKAVEIGSARNSPVSASDNLRARSHLILTLLRLGRPEEAEPIARAALADSETVRGVDHADTLLTRQHLLISLSMLGRHDEVLAESTPLLATLQERLGPNHRLTLALHSTRYESFTALGRYGEAAREAEQVWRGASASSGPESHQALVGQVDYAAVLCLTPERGRGLPIALDAAAKVERAFGVDYALTHVIRYFTAQCLSANNRHAEADTLLKGIDRTKVGQLIGDANWGGQVDLARAEIARAQGDLRRAITFFEAAGTALEESRDADARQRLAVLGRLLGR